MAKYIGLLSSDARGKVGGLVLSRSRSGTTIKSKTIPKHPNSVAQVTAQSVLAGAITSWKALTAGNQTTWSVFAATQVWSNSLGGTYSPTGLQLYTQAWINANWYGATPPANFPTEYTPPQVIAFVSVTVESSFLFMTLTPVTGDYDNPVITFMSRAVLPSTTYTKTKRRVFAGTTVGGSTKDLETEYRTNFGPLPLAGMNLPLRIVPVNPAAYISGTVFASAVNIIS